MTAPRFRTTREAQDAGWFSRRHETSAEHREAQARYAETRGREARQRRASARANPVYKQSRPFNPAEGTDGSNHEGV